MLLMRAIKLIGPYFSHFIFWYIRKYSYEVDIAMMISSQTLRDDNISNQMNEISSIVLSTSV